MKECFGREFASSYRDRESVAVERKISSTSASLVVMSIFAVECKWFGCTTDLRRVMMKLKR